MDILTNIELQLTEVLKDIDNAVTTPAGYNYYNTVTVVNNTDDANATDFGLFPTVSVYQEPDEINKDELANAYFNKTSYVIEGNVALDNESDNPRFDINQKMNELLADIKTVLGTNPTLNCACDMTTITRSNRTYNNSGELFRVGQVRVYVTVQYKQLRTNADMRKY